MTLEIQTIRAMMQIYCRAHHDTTGALCNDCSELLIYAEQRIEKCPFGIKKPVCNHCRVHCYKPDMRDRVRGVMRYAGPRMPLRHPLLAARHLIRSKRYDPGRSK